MIINDDVAVEDSLYTAGRRGVAGRILLDKIAGAAAEERRDLAAVAEVARKVIADARSMGMALTSCTVPAAGRPTFDLPDDQMEVGIGVHGEPGRRRVPVAPAKEVAAMLVEPVLADLDFTGGDGVLAFVNGLGATPLIELYLMYGEVAAILEKAGVRVARTLVGNYFTSLDMAGARSRCSSWTTSCCGCGTPRSTRGLPVGGLSGGDGGLGRAWAAGCARSPTR